MATTDVLSHPRFLSEQAAYDWVEAHLWPHRPVCPRCGGLDRITKLKGKSTRIGVYKCKDCRKPFTVKVGTIFEDSHIPMRMWLQAIALLCASKKGISSNQLHRMLGITPKSAWFMSHRIREAMRKGPLLPPMGGKGGKTVEADETFIGKKKDVPIGPSFHHKHAVLTLIDRNSGEARSFHVDSGRFRGRPIVRQNVARESAMATDEAKHYAQLKDYHHVAINHAREEWAIEEFPHQQLRELFFDFQARHAGHLSALLRQAPARHSRAEGRQGQAAHLSNSWSGLTRIRSGANCIGSFADGAGE